MSLVSQPLPKGKAIFTFQILCTGTGASGANVKILPLLDLNILELHYCSLRSTVGGLCLLNSTSVSVLIVFSQVSFSVAG